jgi:hypothetical protein
MTADDIIRAARECVEVIRRNGFFRPAAKLADTSRVHYPDTLEELEEMLYHIIWCCKQAEGFAAVGDLDKANRWLGFVQGFLWRSGSCSIDDLRDMNRGKDGER